MRRPATSAMPGAGFRLEDAPERSAEICVFEIFVRDVAPGRTVVGMGVHPFGAGHQGRLRATDAAHRAREFHEYAVAWEADHVAFYCDGHLVRVVEQSPECPMQLMLSVYEFAETDESRDPSRYPKEFGVDWVRGYRRS